VVVWFAWFVQDNTVGLLHGLGMISVGEERSEKGLNETLIGFVDSIPDRVGNAAWARGRCVREFPKC